MTPLRKTICAAAVLLACFPMSSTAADIDEDDDGTGKLMVQTFRGWAGIVFPCEYQDPDALLDRICRNARREVESAARAHGVDVSLAPINANGGARRYVEVP